MPLCVDLGGRRIIKKNVDVFTTIPKGWYKGGKYRPRRALVKLNESVDEIMMKSWLSNFFNKYIEMS